MAFIYKQGNHLDKRGLIYAVSRIIVVLPLLTFFRVCQVRCVEEIPSCKDLLKNLQNDEETWHEKCLKPKSRDQMLDSYCCEAEKNYLRTRKCMHSRMCFYKGNTLQETQAACF